MCGKKRGWIYRFVALRLMYDTTAPGSSRANHSDLSAAVDAHANKLVVVMSTENADTRTHAIDCSVYTQSPCAYIRSGSRQRPLES